MEQMQFTAIVLMTLLTLKLLLLPNKVAVDRVMNKSRWLITVGIILIDVQFALQYAIGLRAIGTTPAVMLNLALFMPAAWLLSLAILYLQQRGWVSKKQLAAGPAAWIAGMACIAIAAAIDGQPLLSDTPELRYAEVAASIGYCAMQCYYSGRHIINLIKMHKALQNYYDNDISNILHSMQWSVAILMVMGIITPLLIFGSGLWLAAYAIFFFGGIFYFVDSFCTYVVSTAPLKVQVAEDNEGQTQLATPKETASPPATNHAEASSEGEGETESLHRTGLAVEQWIADGGYRKSGVTMPLAADDMHIPRYLLYAWLKQQGLTYSVWMTNLRIEEAKRVMKAHPEWSNESIATHCGFSDRTYFQKKFKEQTGISPSDFLATT